MSSTSNQERRKKRRWGDASSTTTTTSATNPPPITFAATTNGNGATNTSTIKQKSPIDDKSKALALKASIAARLAALKASKAKSSSTTGNTSKTSQKRPLSQPTNDNHNQPVKKAKVYDLDLSNTTPQFIKEKERREKEKKKKKINPYLAHLEQDEESPTANTTAGAKNKNKQQSDDGNLQPQKIEGGDEILDNRLKGGKNKIVKQRVAHKKLNFIEPGTYIEKAKKKHLSHLNAIQSGYRSGRKQGTFIEATEIANVNDANASTINDDEDGMDSSGVKDKHDYYGTNENQDARTLAPRMDAIYTGSDASNSGGTKLTNGVVPIPLPLVMEWWDLPLLPKQLRKEVVSKEGELVMKSTKQQLYNVFQQKKKGDKAEKNTNEDGNDTNNNENASSKKQNEIATLTQKCYITASITNSKTYKLVQHPKPVIPPSLQNQDEKPKPVLHLTKKELKKQRKLRRAVKQREIQDLQSVGLLPKPEPKLTLSNYMRVLGTQAVLDPSTMEMKVQEQIQARKTKHAKMNLERKVKAKEERDLKKKQEAVSATNDNNLDSVSIALFLVKDMSHRYHRTKVDLNAQQLYITGGVIECQANPKLALVIAEGDAKAIKKYIRLMTVRMKWKGENFAGQDDDDDDDDVNSSGNGMNDDDDAMQDGETKVKQKFNPDNSCELVWTGMSAKRMFRSFLFQSCPTSVHARKVLEAKGVAHFWDQVLVHESGSGETFNFKLG